MNSTEKLTADNGALVLIDHLAGTMLGAQDIRLDQLRSNVLALAKTGRAHGLPTVITVSNVDGLNGPVMSKLFTRGYEVWAVYDASGCWDTTSEVTSCMRLTRMGAIVVNRAGVTAMLQADWRRAEQARQTLGIFGEHLPFYALRASNQKAAQAQGAKGVDTQRSPA